MFTNSWEARGYMHTIGSFVIPKRFVYLCACVYIYKSITATTNNSWQPGISFYIYIYIYIYIHIQPIRGLYKHVYIYIRPISISLVSARRHGEYIISPSLKCWKKIKPKQLHKHTGSHRVAFCAIGLYIARLL